MYLLSSILLYVENIECNLFIFSVQLSRIVVVVNMHTPSVVDRGFEPRAGPKVYKNDICCFLAKHVALRSKSKGWLNVNHDNASDWSDMSTRGLLFQWASTIQIQLSMLV
jgi:hypothetical protein